MNYYATHARGLGAVQARLAGDCPVVTWAGKEWLVVPGSAVRRKDLDDGGGGFQLNADFRFEALVGQFLTAPGATPEVLDATGLEQAMLQTEIGYLGESYKAVAMHVGPGALVVRVDCNSLGQGA
jgi:hypothetical protein